MELTVVARLKTLVQEERRITTEILQLLMTVEDRKVYAEMGYPSMYEFCRKELKYSEGAAYRRISAMRLMKQNSEVQSKLESGELSLTTASQVQTAFSRLRRANVKVSAECSRKLVNSVESKSKREVEKLLAETVVSLAPDLAEALNESEKVVSLGNGLSRIELVVPDELIEKLDQLMAQVSHAVPNRKYLDLVKYLVEGRLKQFGKSESLTQTHLAGEVTSRQSGPNRYVASSIKREVFQRDGGKCTFVNPETGSRCGGNHFIQFDHMVPVAFGGKSTSGNLRLFCATHNRLAAEKLGLMQHPGLILGDHPLDQARKPLHNGLTAKS